MQVLSYFGFFKVLKVTATSSRLLAIGSLSLFIWHLASGNWHLKTVRDYKCWQKNRFTTNPSCNSFKTLNAESQTLQLSFHKPLSQKGGETASASFNQFFSFWLKAFFITSSTNTHWISCSGKFTNPAPAPPPAWLPACDRLTEVEAVKPHVPKLYTRKH